MPHTGVMAGHTSVAAHDTVEQLKTSIKMSKDERQKTRLRAILALREGATGAAIAQRFVVSERSVRKWVCKYNEGGAEALVTNKGGRPGGNPKWDAKIFDALTEEIDKGGRYWSVPIMQEWIKENYKKDIPENTVWYHVTGLDYSYKSARPHPYRGNKETQDAFKRGEVVPFV